MALVFLYKYVYADVVHFPPKFLVALSVLSYEGQTNKLISTSLQHLTSLETLRSDELCVGGMPEPYRHRSLLPGLRLNFAGCGCSGLSNFCM